MRPPAGQLAFALRPATPDDRDGIYALRRAGLRDYVEATWGWDEADQSARFDARFDPARYRIVVVEGQEVGALSLEWGDDMLLLADIQIGPEWRGRGLGTAIIEGLIDEARQRALPVALGVLKVSPARGLYERLGFREVAETSTHLYMRSEAMPEEKVSPLAAAPSIGLARSITRLVPHDPAWSGLFAAEAARLRAALGEQALAIEHVGSTAVAGLAAKPIIDIMIGVEDLDDCDGHVRALEAIGYERRPVGDLPGRLYLVLGEGDMRWAHLSLAEMTSPFWSDHLTFRDRLRADAAAAEAYGRLKEGLAARFRHDRISYTDGKEDFIADVLAAADE